MSKLREAMELAQARKNLVGEGREGIVLAHNEFQDRAIFSGFDIGYEELVATSMAVGDMYCQASAIFGLRSLFISSWCDGLLTGMLLASLPDTPSEDSELH